jgi:hypothetical protein
MRVIRFIAAIAITIASLIGGFLTLDIIPNKRLEGLPEWVQLILIMCMIICPGAALFLYVCDYRKVQRQRRESHENKSSKQN